jgi:PAB-dependent poly(A)-specific ribonuclease subunit 2
MCELGFLFRMLEDAKGINCQATNFYKAFGNIPEGKFHFAQTQRLLLVC